MGRARVRLPLRVFLFAALAVATLAPIAYLGPTQVARWRKVQGRDADRELQFAAESLARAVGQAIDDSVRGLTTTANHIGTYGSLDEETLQTVLHDYCANFPSCLGVNISNLEARPFVTDPPGRFDVSFADRRYYQEMERTGRTVVSGVEMGRITKVPTIHVAAPIWSTAKDGKKERLGSLVSAVGLSYLQELAGRSVGVLGDMRVLVVDHRKRVILDSKPGGLSPLADLSGYVLYADAPAGPAVLRDGRDEVGERVRAAAARVSDQNLGWTVAVLRPIATIEEQAERARWSTLVAVLGALALGLAFAFVLSAWLARPISRIARYTQQVAGGDQVPPPSSAHWDAREVTELLGTVGTMVARLRSQADELRGREQEQVELARLKRELEIAEHIQTGILPKRFEVPGFEIAALMQPAEVVGGDYYDLLPTNAGLWIAVGDVSEHGLTAGLVMVMLQSALGSLVSHSPSASPSEVWGAVNRLLVDNIRSRLGGDDHVTVVLARVAPDGRYVFAGGHEPIVVLPAGASKCEVIPTPGPWMGIRPDLAMNLRETSGSLGAGDLMVFYSDGIVEAGAAHRKPFGIDGLCAAVERLRDQPARTLCSDIVREAREWAGGRQEDDMTVLVLRRN
jgi:sigma-B regulation protein RsbU (phosphoserine phosphatase)